jgi:hypothetical protein
MISTILASRTEGETLPVSGFFDWLSHLSDEDRILPQSNFFGKVDFPPLSDIVSYRAFVASPNLFFVLDGLLLVSSEDVFAHQEVAGLLSEFGRVFNIHVSDELIQTWFISRVGGEEVLSLPHDSPLFKFLRCSFGKVCYEDENFIQVFTLSIILGQTSHMEFIPALNALRGSYPSAIKGTCWLQTIALWCCFNMDHYESVSQFFEIFFNQSSMWDNDSKIPLIFGQLGIGYVNPMIAVIECFSNGADIAPCTVSELNEFTVLALIFRFEKTGEGIDNILKIYNKMENRRIGTCILDKVFDPIVKRYWYDVEYDMDVSIIDSTLCLVEGIEDTSWYIKSLHLTRLVILAKGWRQELTNVLASQEKEDIIDFLVCIAMSSRNNEKLANETAFKIGLKAELDSRIVSSLLSDCFDSDIDLHIDSISSSDFASLIESTVLDRLSVVVSIMCEDTSRFHGMTSLVPTSMLLGRRMSNPSTRQLIQDWIAEDGDFRGVLDSCIHLLSHPKLIGIGRLEYLKRIILPL